ncbi:Uncharacterised protein [Vibrio cholerae]|nr:Uncharacterised protein [Vibrio cholerae]
MWSLTDLAHQFAKPRGDMTVEERLLRFFGSILVTTFLT